MRKGVLLILLLAFAASGFAEAGQYRIAPPSHQRKRQPPKNYRESRLDIVNEDDRSYAVDIDYRNNRLELQPRNMGDVFIPANSRISLLFDDDDNWRIYGDNDSLEIEIRAGGITTLRLETKKNRNQIGLFATMDDGKRVRQKQLFKYAERPGRRHDNRPSTPVVVVQPPPPPPPVIVEYPAARPLPPPPPQPVVVVQQPRPTYTPPPVVVVQPAPPPKQSIGSAVGGIIDSLVEKDRDRPRR